MIRWRRIGTAWCIAAAAWSALAAPGRAVNIVLDFTYDDNGFFGAGNPTGQGAAAKAALQAVASYYSTILTDTLSAVVEPPDFHSAVGTGVAYWDWSFPIQDPETGAQISIQHPTIAADEYRLYVGARSLGGDTLGIGGTSVVSGPSWGYGGSWGPGELTQVNQITANFTDAIAHRGEPTGFATWGGYVTFDNDASTTWHYNHNTTPAAGASDFYSVATHEIGHSLGLGSSTEWTNLAPGANFSGAAATAAYGGPPPLQSPSRNHWAPGTMSKILGTNTVQEAAMDPEITNGTRKYLTSLDAGALTDIGWEVVGPTYNSADFNTDGTVNGPDLAVWRGAYGSTGADANGDGVSDGDDFLLWQRRLGHIGPAVAAGSPVPEPASAVAVAWIVGAAAWRLRGRRTSA